MKNFTVKNLALSIVIVVFGLTLLLGLSAALVECVVFFDNSSTYMIISYAKSIQGMENGFDLLAFNSKTECMNTDENMWIVKCVSFSSFFQWIISVIIIICGVICSLQNSKKARGFSIAFMTVGLIFSVVYMVLGIIYSNIFRTAYNYPYSKSFIVYTKAWIPFVLCLIIYVTYFILKGILKDKATVVDEIVKDASSDENHEIETLIKYKDLLDKGIITEEEFAKKKRKILQ
ncbi:MAG: SHOCT domain-containing protein [Clostridia bacterium]|nr:SHOCT domain-containing protein [Clostridia bacterium]